MILAINTSTREFSLSVLKENGAVISEVFMAEGKNHFGGLMASLDFLFKTSDYSLFELKAIAVATGPGSFTGLRVGLSTAKGLCHGLGIPIITVPSLDALAHGALFSDYDIAPVLDSRREEFFTALFEYNNASLVRKTEYLSLHLKEFPLFFEKPVLFVGNNFSSQGPVIKDCMGNKAILAPSHCWNLKASVVGALALKKFHARQFDTPENVSPIYLRPPDIRPYSPASSRINENDSARAQD